MKSEKCFVDGRTYGRMDIVTGFIRRNE